MTDAAMRKLSTRDPLSTKALRARSRTWEPLAAGKCKGDGTPCEGLEGMNESGPCPKCHDTSKRFLTTTERLKLGAYCGDARCRKIVGNQLCANDGCCGHGTEDQTCSRSTFNGWLLRLARWPQALLRAAVATAEVAHKKQCSDKCHLEFDESLHTLPCRLVLSTIEAAKTWLADPTPKNQEAWRLAWRALRGPLNAMQWVPAPSDPPETSLICIQTVFRLIRKKVVQEEICKALITWIL